MAVKETPINTRQYYSLMLNRTRTKLEAAKKEILKLKEETEKLNKEFASRADEYKLNFNINLYDYDEFVLNRYTIGKFLRVTKGLFINRQNDYELVADLYDLHEYAIKLHKIHVAENQVKHYEKLVDLKYKDYIELLRTYYTEVHKQMVIEGKGYSFGSGIGWICINRVRNSKKNTHINFAATKKREQELIAQGKRIYNKEEAAWCAKNGIEYKAEDKRVYLNDEYFYEIPLINSKLTDGTKLKFSVTDYRKSDVRGKTNEELIEICNKDLNKICELPVDVKTKLTMCNKVDKTLYIKFIRNENQKALATRKANSKNR